jgi:hypothetical protein
MRKPLGLALLVLTALPAWAGGTVSTETFYSQALGVNKAFATPFNFFDHTTTENAAAPAHAYLWRRGP